MDVLRTPVQAPARNASYHDLPYWPSIPVPNRDLAFRGWLDWVVNPGRVRMPAG